MNLVPCKDCDQKISARAHTCPHCGCPANPLIKASVNVNNIDMEFGTMVTFMVKAAIAAIPAAIIIVVLGGLTVALLGGMLHR